MDGMEGSNGPDMWRTAGQDLGRRGSPALRTTDSAPGDDRGRPPGLQHSWWGSGQQKAPAAAAGTREASGQVTAGPRQQKQVILSRQGDGGPGEWVGAAQSGLWLCLLRRLWSVVDQDLQPAASGRCVMPAECCCLCHLA